MLLVFTIAAVLVGLILGFLGRLANPTPQSITLISFPGELLMRLLKMFILPLIVSSLISGMAQLDPKGSGRMGYRALLYYTVTTILAAIVGIVMVLIIHPGDPRIKSVITAHKADYTKISTLDAILDIIRYVKYMRNRVVYYREIPFLETWCRKIWCRRASSRRKLLT